MQHIKTRDDVKKLGTILSVWAHPDDESFSCGGIMAAAAQNGQKVVCVTATKGEAGVQDPDRWPPEQLADIRDKEMKAALGVLGITEHHWLGYADGKCHTVPEKEGVARVRAFIDSIKPDTILTFGPDGMTGHTDHQTVSRWATEAAEGTDVAVYHSVEEEDAYESYLKEADKKFNIYFNIDKPPVRKQADCEVCFCLDDVSMKKKCDALRAMPSQTEAMFKTMPQEFFDAAFCCETFVRAR